MRYKKNINWLFQDYTSSLHIASIAALFGTRLGLTIYLATLCFFGVVLRVDFLITDSYTLANGLYSLSNGQLVLTDPIYGPSLQTPGAEPLNGNIIARNYGAIVLSLPFWTILAGLTGIADLAVTLVCVWSLVLLLLVVQIGLLLDSHRAMTVGSMAVLVLFGVNIAFVEYISPRMTYLLALQFFHVAVAALVPVFLYRLFSRLETNQLGITAAAVSVMGTPLAVWGMYPKRHALTAAVVVMMAYTLYRSRNEPDGMLVTDPVVFRALAYVLVGLYAWVHAPEALVLLVILAIVDIPTASDNSPRTLAVVGICFFISLIPFLLTNALVVGNPLKPPRLIAKDGIISPASGSGGPSPAGGSGGAGAGAIFLQAVRSAVEPVLILQGLLAEGAKAIVREPDRVYHTVVRSGAAERALDLTGQQSVNLTILESAPVLAALLGAFPALWTRLQSPISLRRVLSGSRVVDAFALLLCLALTLLYATRLPLHAQITVRYLFPVYPLGVYLLFRLPQIRTTLTKRWRAFFWTLGVVVLIGSQLYIVALDQFVASLGEAFQLHALISLTVALFLGVWALASRSQQHAGQLGAVLLGIATGVTTQFVLFTSVIYYPLGNSHMLPIVRLFAESLPLL